MQAEALQFTVNTQGAQADLGALSRALDGAGRAFDGFTKTVGSDANKIDASLQKSMRSAEKAAKVAALLGQVKIGNSANALKEFASALDTLGRARMITDAKVKGLQEFLKLLPSIRAPSGGPQIAAFMQAIGTARAPTQAQTRNLSEFLKVLGTYKGSSATRGGTQLQSFLTALSGATAPSASTIKRLQEFLSTLSNMRGIPNASKIANDLVMLSTAAARATAAFGQLPRNLRGFAGPANQASNAITGVGKAAQQTGRQTAAIGQQLAGTRQHVKGLGGDLSILGDRFKLSYQAGTIFSALFSSFTIGQFVKGIYDAGVMMLKLQKALLFTSGSFDGATKATGRYFAMAQDLGLSIDKTAESYGRFMISSKAAGVSQDVAHNAFKDVSLALQVVGASAEQTQYAFYGLTQMMQKGKVSSEELNRQIGEQIPGSAEAARRALTKLEGKGVTMAQMFKKIQSGTVQSDTFVPAYGAELEKMYKPLKELINARPDVQLNKLGNAFKLFQVQIASAGFLGATSGAFGSLSSQLVKTKNGVIELDEKGMPQLTESAQKLATTIGANLGKAIQTAGNFFKYLAEHLDQVVFAAKALLAIKIGSTLVGWGRDAASAAAGFNVLKTSLFGVAAAKEAVDAANGPSMKAGKLSKVDAGAQLAQDFASSGSVFGARGGAKIAERGGPNLGFSPVDAPVLGNFGKRAKPITRNAGRVVQGLAGEGAEVATAASMAAKVTKAEPLLGAGLGRAASAGLGPIRALLGLLSNVHPVLKIIFVTLTALGAAWALFGNRMTEVGGKTMKVNDVLGASFTILTRNISTAWTNGIGKNFKEFNKWLDDLAKNNGGWAVAISASFVWLGEFIGAVMKDITDSLLLPFKQLGKAIDILKSGGSVADAWKGAANEAPKGIKDTAVGRMRSFDDIKKDVIKTASESVDKRNNAGHYDESEAKRKNAEDQLARENAANDAAAALGRRQAYQELIKAQITAQTPTYEELRKSFSDLAESARTAADGVKAMGEGVATASLQGGSGKDQAYNLLKNFEGYKEKAYWDVNAYRAGFGSDTYTDDKGVHKVTKDSKVGGTEAAADLKRRIGIFTDSASKTVGTDNWEKLSATTQAALTSITYNYGSLPKRLIAAVKTGDNGTIATAVEGLAGDNKGVNADRRRQEAALIRNGAVKSITEDDTEKMAAKINNAKGTYEGIVASLNPGQAAISDMNKFILVLQDLKKTQEDLNKEAPGAPQIVDLKVLDEAIARKRKEVAEATNPLAKLNADNEKAAAIDKLRATGMSDLANWQEQLNRLEEQGYPASVLNLEVEKQRFLQNAKTARQLQSQIDLQSTLNDVEQSRAQRLGTSFQAAEVSAVAKAANPGESIDAARKRMQDDGTYGNVTQGVQAQETERKATAKSAIEGSLTEAAATARMNPTTKALRDDYKQYLEDLTGLSGLTLSELEKRSSATDRAMADSYAKLKEKLENPPGFQRWADSLEPLAKRLQDIKANFMDTFSQGITDALSGEKVDWRAMAQNLSKQMLKAQVDTALAGFTKWATGGKAVTPEQKAEAASTAQVSAADVQATAAETQLRAANLMEQAIAGQGAGGTGAPGVAGGAQGGATGLQGVIAEATRALAVNDNFLQGLKVDQTGGPGFQAAGAGLPNLAGMSSMFKPANDDAEFLKGTGYDPKTGVNGLSGVEVGGGTPRAPVDLISQALSSVMGPLQGLTVDQTGGAGFMPAGTGIPGLGDQAGGIGSIISSIFGGGGAAGGGIMSAISSIFGGGAGAAAGPAGGIMSAVSSIFGGGGGAAGAGGGIMSAISSIFGGGGGAGGAAGGMGGIMSAVSSIFGGGGGGAAGGGLGSLAKSFMGGGHGGLKGIATAAMPLIGSLLFKKKKKKEEEVKPVHGIIGAMNSGTMTGTAVAGHANTIGSILSTLVSIGSGGMGGGGGGIGAFKEGGISTSPAQKVMSSHSFHDVPHYKEGTPNTSGDGIPAMLHPNEAVIPLSRGRSVPVEMSGADRQAPNVTVHSPITVVANDANSFRASSGAIERKQNVRLKRAGMRNLTG